MINYLFISIIISSLLYIYLHKKTHISLRFLYIDNIIVIILSTALSYGFSLILPQKLFYLSFLVIFSLIPTIAFSFTMVRFWRIPQRIIKASKNEIVSPADGRVIYIVEVDAGEIPVSIKGNIYSKLEELIKTDILESPYWLIGINMTPFDVHKNCAPIDGKIILNQHFKGSFYSLKDKKSLKENERNTYVIQGENLKVGIVQIASRLVRRIDSYKKVGEGVRQGEWLGMIRFGSQVDIILPVRCNISVKIDQQVYAGTTIIAKLSK